MVLIFTDNEILNKDLNKNIENSRVVYYPDYILEEKEANIIYRETRINKEEMKKILGEEGSVIVKDQNGEMVAEINKDSETNEEGKVVITYPEDEKEIKLETSKPENIGTLNIENTKGI